MITKLRVLFIDDSGRDVQSLLDQFRNAGVEPAHRRVATPAALDNALADQAWDVVICECELRHLDVADVATALRDRNPAVPLIVASTAPDEELAAEMMRMGARDYVSKSNPARLTPAAVREVRSARAARERDRLELDQVTSDFVSSVTHELRAPLTSLKVYADILAAGDAGPLSSEQLKYVKTIQASTDRLGTIVDDLLEVSRIESTQFELDVTDFDLRESVESAASSLAGLFREREMALEVDLPDRPVYVTGDRDRTTQVFVNLLSNAQKYGSPGTAARVRISAKGSVARADVTDAGAGISRDDQKNLFSKFFRTRSSRQSGIPGTGLGLSIAKTLVEAQDGRIWLKSREGRGSTFSFALPLAGEPRTGGRTPKRA